MDLEKQVFPTAIQILFDQILQKNHEECIHFVERNYISNTKPTDLIVTEETGRITGGTCWDEEDEDPTYYESVPEKQIFAGVVYSFKSLLHDISEQLNVPKEQVDTWLKTKPYEYITHYSEMGYYGNSSEKNIYKLSLEKFVDKFCNKQVKEQYLETVQNFVPQVKMKNRLW